MPVKDEWIPKPRYGVCLECGGPTTNIPDTKANRSVIEALGSTHIEEHFSGCSQVDWTAP